MFKTQNGSGVSRRDFFAATLVLPLVGCIERTIGHLNTEYTIGKEKFTITNVFQYTFEGTLNGKPFKNVYNTTLPNSKITIRQSGAVDTFIYEYEK